MTYSFSDWQAGKIPPKGWDCADAIDDGWTADNITAFMIACVREFTPQELGEVKAEPPAAEVQKPKQAPPAREMRPIQQAKPAEDDPKVVDMKTRLRVVEDDHWMTMLEFTEGENKLKVGLQWNWSLYLQYHPDLAGCIRYNEFKREVWIVKALPWNKAENFKVRPIVDSDYSEAAMWLERKGMTPSVSKIVPIVHAIAHRNSFDPLHDYLNKIKWDGTSRVDTWLSYYCGVADSPYVRSVGKKFLISAAARGLVPGCKCDTMIILEGDQGLGKSKFLRALFSDDFFTDQQSAISTKDFSQELQGVWCAEVGEMHNFSEGNIDEVKKVLSRQIDRYRPPYGRSVIEAPRRTVFAGTFNPDGNGYLRDVTGARRFWPVEATVLDVDSILEDRDQLWAEAVHLFRSGEKWWMGVDEIDMTKIEQAKRAAVDIWHDILGDAVKMKASVSMKEILEILDISNKAANKSHQDRIGRVMYGLGWKQSRIDGAATFTKPGAVHSAVDADDVW